jgi:hypothetical protein
MAADQLPCQVIIQQFCRFVWYADAGQLGDQMLSRWLALLTLSDGKKGFASPGSY